MTDEEKAAISISAIVSVLNWTRDNRTKLCEIARIVNVGEGS